MIPRRLAALAGAIALCLTVAVGADTELAPYEGYLSNSLPYTALGLPTATRVNTFQADAATRVWAATDKGVAALLSDREAPFFPLASGADELQGDDVTAVAFGRLGGNESFFLGFRAAGAPGIQYGRMLSESGLQPRPPDLLERNEPDDPPGVNAIAGLSTNGSTLWAATRGGLVEWTLDKEVPESGSILLKGAAISHVATDPWATSTPSTVYSRGTDLFLAPSETPFDSLPDAPVAFAFDDRRMLWVATAGNELFRFPVSEDPAQPYGTRLGPYVLGDGARTLTSITVDPINPSGTVIWVGTDRGAYLQIADPATGDLTPSAWVQANTVGADANVKVYADPTGTVWFGSSFGVRSLLSRLVTIDSTRFSGFGARAVITLVDVNPNAPGRPDTSPPDTLPVFIVKKGGSLTAPELTLAATRQPDGTYRATFAFAATTVEGQALGVGGSAADAVYEIAYSFGPEGNKRELPRPTFSWTNVVPSQAYADYLRNSLSFSELKLGLANRVNSLRADGVNRVWATTDKGVAAIQVDALARFFPLTKVSDGLTGDDVAAAAFGRLDKKPNFFLGYGTQGASGIQYGRVLSETGLQPKPPNVLIRSESGDPVGLNVINELASKGAKGDTLWAATQGGLVPRTLGGLVPVDEDLLLKGSVVSHVAADPWSSGPAFTVYASGGDLFVLPSKAPESSFDSLGTNYSVVGLAFDANRTLWVAARRGSDSYELYRYPYTGNPDHPYDRLHRRGPYRLGDSLRLIRSIAVDPLSAAGTVVWVGTDRGAFYQVVDPATGDLVSDGWLAADTSVSDTDVKVYVDPSGNLWFGSSFGVRSLVSRLLTMSSDRFVGYGTRAVIDLVDINPNAPGPPPDAPPDTLTVFIVKEDGQVSSAELELTATRQPGSNTYRAEFTFAATTVPGQALGVTSSAQDVVYEVVYPFGPSRREVPRPSFSWANIVPFEDDLWIGGPCFLNALGR
ncbi:MAG: hypothetical protein HZB55_09970 [Deltaproteobacteria bacterium]|nr:hypothetical protein [Deltaproteobacteria bacterium]